MDEIQGKFSKISRAHAQSRSKVGVSFYLSFMFKRLPVPTLVIKLKRGKR